MFRQWLLLCLVALFGVSTPASAQGDCPPSTTPAVIEDLSKAVAKTPRQTAEDNLATVTAGPTVKDAPKTIAFPKVFDEGGNKSWKDSFPKKKSQEQGGILVRQKDGTYEWRRGPPGTSGTFSPNYGDLKDGETMVASLHTHPYDESEGGDLGVGPSGGDISSMVYQLEPNTVVHAGNKVFAVVATKEFNDSLVGLSEEKLAEKVADMEKTFTDAMTKAYETKDFDEAVNHAAAVTSTKHDLILYEGKPGGILTRVN